MQLPILQQVTAFFPQDQINLIVSELRTVLNHQPNGDQYIQLVADSLALYGTHKDELDSEAKPLAALEYISDLDLWGNDGLINALAQSCLDFSPEKPQEENKKIVFNVVDLFIRGQYRPFCCLFEGVLDAQQLYKNNTRTPVIFKNSENNEIWIYGSPDGKPSLVKSKNPEVYASLNFPDQIGQRIDEPYAVYEDIKKLKAQDYPGYKPFRKNLSVSGSSQVFAKRLERWHCNFLAACVNHKSSPSLDQLNSNLPSLFLKTIEDYCRENRLSIVELDFCVEAVAKEAVTIYANIANIHLNEGYRLASFQSWGKERADLENLELVLKDSLFPFLDKHVLPKVRELQRQAVEVYDEERPDAYLGDGEITQLLNFLIPKAPDGVGICEAFTISSDGKLQQLERQTGEKKLARALGASPDILYIPLNLGQGHWVKVKSGKQTNNQYRNDYTDSCSAQDWVLPQLRKFLSGANESGLNGKSFVDGQSIGTEKQRHDGYTCGDRTVWTIFEDVFPGEISPWRWAGLTEDSPAEQIREVTNILKAIAKDKSQDALPWKEVLEKDAYKRRMSPSKHPRYSGGPSESGSWFDNHGFLLFLAFSLAVLCFVSIGFGLTALFGAGHALEVAAQFFPHIPAALSLKSAAFISVLAGGIGGPVILFGIWDGLVNFKNDVVFFFTPSPNGPTKFQAPSAPETPQSRKPVVPSQRPDPEVVATPRSPVSQTPSPKSNQTPGARAPSPPNPTGYHTPQ